MEDSPIRFEHVKVGELYDFAKGVIQGAAPGQFIPITTQRALAQSKNPFADPEDVGLLVAYSGGRVVGYFGIMPVMLKHGDQMSKAHWFTGWMVSPELRGHGLGSGLMAEALTLDLDYLIVGSAPARRVCCKFGFHDFEPLTYSLIDFNPIERYNPVTLALRATRKLLRLLGIRLDIDKLSGSAAGVFGRLFNSLLKPLFHRWALRRAGDVEEGLQINQVERVSAVEDSVVRKKAEVRLYRGPEAVNWMLAYPWVVEPGESASEQMDYYFSDVRPRFEFIALQVSGEGGENLGYMVFLLSQRGEKLVLKALDHEFANPEYKRLVLAQALRLAAREGVDEIEIGVELARRLQGGLMGRLLLQSKLRYYQCHPRSSDSPLGRNWQQLKLDYCDGDTPFT